MNSWEGGFTCFVCQVVTGAARHLNLHKEVLQRGAMERASPDRNAVNCGLPSWEMQLRFGWVLTFAVNTSIHVALLTSKIPHAVSGLNDTWGVQVWMKGKHGVCPSSVCLHSWLGTASLLVGRCTPTRCNYQVLHHLESSWNKEWASVWNVFLQKLTSTSALAYE